MPPELVWLIYRALLLDEWILAMRQFEFHLELVTSLRRRARAIPVLPFTTPLVPCPYMFHLSGTCPVRVRIEWNNRCSSHSDLFLPEPTTFVVEVGYPVRHCRCPDLLYTTPMPCTPKNDRICLMFGDMPQRCHCRAVHCTLRSVDRIRYRSKVIVAGLDFSSVHVEHKKNFLR